MLNGTPATGNQWLLRDILRQRFGFKGPLISDYSAIGELQAHGMVESSLAASKAALSAGVDLDMMTAVYAQSLPELVKQPQFAKLLDEAVWRLLSLKNELGLFEQPFRGLNEPQTGAVLQPDARALATELVEKSVVMLKNNGALPLMKNQRIALIGPYGDSRLTLGFWASVTGRPDDTVTLHQGLNEYYQASQLKLARGYNLFTSYDGLGIYREPLEYACGPILPDQQLLDEAVATARQADVIVVTIGEQFMESGEAASKTNLHLPIRQVALLKALRQLGKPIIGILYSGRPLVLTEVENYFDSLLIAWYPGTMGGAGLAHLLVGQASPSARLAMSFPYAEGQIPIYGTQLTTGRPLTSTNETGRFVSSYRDAPNGPLHAFGSGLSYGRFEVSELTAEIVGSNLQVHYTIKNTGAMGSGSVSFLYLGRNASLVVEPEQRLIGSQYCQLHAGESRRQSICVPCKRFIRFDNNGNALPASKKLKLLLDVYGTQLTYTLVLGEEKNENN